MLFMICKVHCNVSATNPSQLTLNIQSQSLRAASLRCLMHSTLQHRVPVSIHADAGKATLRRASVHPPVVSLAGARPSYADCMPPVMK